MRRLRKAVAVGLAAAMTLSSAGLQGLTVMAGGLPITQGHDKYVDSNVFNVIADDSFGTTELESPLFDKTKGSSDIKNLQVPTLAYDDTSIALVWDKPEKYDNVADYNVYINGKKAGTARENYAENAQWANTYMKSFYDYYKDTSDVDMVNVDIHSYRATGLTPDTEYIFKVVAVDASGNELGTPKEIIQKTTVKPEEFNILDYGAVATKGYTSYDDEINEFIEKNTKAIQSAIDACTPGGKVVIPKMEDGSVFVSGALWLKSDITVELDGTLWASPNSDHFEIGFLMYPFYTDTRGWGLLNATSADEGTPLENIRVTGNGKLYGNGWKYGAKDKMAGDGYTSNAGANTQAGDPSDTDNWGLPRYMGGSNTKVYYYGVQAADSAKKYLANLTNEDGSRKYSDELINSLSGYIENDLADNGKVDKNGKDKFVDVVTGEDAGVDKADITNAYATRSSLLIMRNVTNVYVGDITVDNPANHSVNILDSRNISAENIKVFSYDGNNGDGLGFGCSQNVVCWNNFTDTGDDNLGFGASVGEGARDCDIQTNSEIWMFNNFLREGHGGLAAGSHTGNGIQDVLFEDTVMNHIDMAFRFKSAPTNGGFIANITMRDCAVADTQQAWVLTTSYSDPNSASTTEFAEIGKFYNFASYNVSVYGVQYNTLQVLADVDPVKNPNKPWHTHSHLYFQDITFGNVGTNGAFKNKNGWESLIGCENAVFYNFKTISYSPNAVSKKTDKTWNNMQYCKDIVFQGTTWDSVNNSIDKMKNLMSGITVADNTVKAEVIPVSTIDTSVTDIQASKPESTAAQQTTEVQKTVIQQSAEESETTAAAAQQSTKVQKTVIQQSAEELETTAAAAQQSTKVQKTVIQQSAEESKTTDTAIQQTTQGQKAVQQIVEESKTTDITAQQTTQAQTEDKTASAIINPAVTEAAADTADASTERQVKLSWNAVDNGNENVFYGVDTYIDGNKVDIKDGIEATDVTIGRLSSGTEYTFKVYVSEKGDNANGMSVTGQNKTLLGEVTVKVDGEDTKETTVSQESQVTLSSPVYTHAQASWNSISGADARIRGYKIYANGKLVNTVYNYQIPSFETAETISKQVGRLTPGVENKVQIVAFTDSGIEYKYPESTVTTLANYDYKAPVFAADAKLTAKIDGDDVVLTWDAATDDTAVGGYRVYVDGTPVVSEGEEFNPVNGAVTTKDTTYTVKGLDLTKEHTFTVQAGDTWWKAEQTMGTYDKMAGFNWTVKGLSATTDAKAEAEVEFSATADKTSVNSGEEVTVNTQLKNGKGDYTYKFIVYNTETKQWTKLQDFSESSSYTWKATGKCEQIIYVDAKDSTGKVTRSNAVKVNVTEAVKNLSIEAAKKEADKTVTFTAKADGGAGGYTYKFIVYNKTTGKWAKLQDFSSKNTYTWTKGNEGERVFYVDVKDSTGKVVRSKALDVKIGTLTTVPSASLTASADKTNIGGKVTLTAKASQGSGKYTYKFIIYNKTTKQWAKLKDFSSNSSITWTAGVAGDREFYVDVKDSNGNVTRSKAAEVSVSKPADKLSVKAAASTTESKVGESVTFTALGNGGVGGYTYKFIVYNKTTNKWAKLHDFSAVNKLTWKAQTAGERSFYVDVKDNNGNIVRSAVMNIKSSK